MDLHPRSTMRLSLFPLMNRQAPAPGPTAGCAYIAVGMQRALESAIGLPRRSTRAASMLWLLTPPDVSSSFMPPPRVRTGVITGDTTIQALDIHRWRPGSALLELLGEHDEDPAGAADIRELVHVPVGRNAAQGVAAVPRRDLEGFVDVVDREGHAVHADLVGTGGLRLDRVGVDVLEELEATVAIRCLQHGDPGVVAVEADGCVG